MRLDNSAVRRAWQRIEFELELPPGAVRQREVVLAAADILKAGMDALEVDQQTTESLLSQVRQIASRQTQAIPGV